jgi:hypothetical protein
MYDNNYELEECMALMACVLLLLSITAVIALGFILLFVWFNIFLAAAFIFSVWVLVRSLKYLSTPREE